MPPEELAQRAPKPRTTFPVRRNWYQNMWDPGYMRGVLKEKEFSSTYSSDPGRVL
jgi:hypothetical protein